jgi:hypothetical protein
LQNTLENKKQIMKDCEDDGKNEYKIQIPSQVLVTHASNSSYSGGRDQKGHSWKPA